MKIQNITAREILDSRGNPTLSTTALLSDGVIAEASVPSGASTGKGEAVELRDKNRGRFMGMGELSAMSNVNNVIGPALRGYESTNQEEIDNLMIELDGTKDKGNLGANAILSVSLAVARATAVSEGLELYEYLSLLYTGEKECKYQIPTPMFNVLNGGKHAENNVDIQETMIVPTEFKTFAEKLRAGSEIYHILKSTLASSGKKTGLGDEGGFAPDVAKNEEVFTCIKQAIKESGYTGKKVRLSIDLAATELYANNKYQFINSGKSLTSQELINTLIGWSKDHNLLSIEDGLAENDSYWKDLTKKISPTLTIGDDLFTTNPEKIELGAKEKIASGVIIKPNQIGTLTETFEAIRKAKEGKLKVIISHRSGETEDSFIADLSVGVGADYIKSGAPARSERLAKYNRLCRIEEEITENY
jgi:enolase